MDLFASRVSHRFPQYMSWKTELGERCLSNIIGSQVFLCFSSFCTHRTDFSESKSGSVSDAQNNSRIAKFWGNTGKMSVKYPLLLPALKNLLQNPVRKVNIFAIYSSLRLVVSTISGRTYLLKEYQKGFPTLSQAIWNIFD